MKYSLYVSVIGLILFIIGITVTTADEPLSALLIWLGIIGAYLAIFLLLKYVYNPIHKKLTISKRWNLLLAWNAVFLIAFYALMFRMASFTDEGERAIRIVIYTVIFLVILVITLIDNIKKRHSRSK